MILILMTQQIFISLEDEKIYGTGGENSKVVATKKDRNS
jgi:hypothetical protein